MAATNQSKPSWDAFDKIFDEAFSRTKATASRPPYFSPTPFTPYPPTEYGYEPTFTPYPGHPGRNNGDNGDDEDDFQPPKQYHHAEPDDDEMHGHGFREDDFYSRADMEYYEDDDYEKEFWSQRAKKAQTTGTDGSGSRKPGALELTDGPKNGIGSTIGGTKLSQAQPSIVSPKLLQSNAFPLPRPTTTTNAVSNVNNPTMGGGTGMMSGSNPLSNAMTAFSSAAAALNGLTNALNGLGLGPTANQANSSSESSIPSAPFVPRGSAPVASQVPTLGQPRPPLRKPPPPLNLDDYSSGSASSSSPDPTSPFKLSPGPSPPPPPPPAVSTQLQPQLTSQGHSQFQFQQYQFQPSNEISMSRSMFLQQQQQQQQQQQTTQTQQKTKVQTNASQRQGQGQGQDQGKTHAQVQGQIPPQFRSQTQPIPVPSGSKAPVQPLVQKNDSRSLDPGVGVPFTSPLPGSGPASFLSTSPNPTSGDRDDMKSPTPSSSTIHKKRRPNPGKVTFRDSSDGTRTTATFDLQGIKKSDVHVSFQNDKVVVSWETVNVEEKMEDGKIVRERRENKFTRTLPLPRGAKSHEYDKLELRHLVAIIFKNARMLRNATFSTLPYLIPRHYVNFLRRQRFTTSFTSAHPEPNKPIQLDSDLQDLLRDVDVSLARSKARLRRKSEELKEDSILHRELQVVSRTAPVERLEVDNEEDDAVEDSAFSRFERKSPAAAYGSRRIGSVILPFEMQKSILNLISESDKPLVHADANRLFNPLDKEDRPEQYGRNSSTWSLHYTPSQSTEAHSASRVSHIKARLTKIRDGTAFASVVMPAQYAVIRAVLEQIKSRLGSQWSQKVDRVIEWGSGTGAGIWAAHHTFQTLHERPPIQATSDETSEPTEQTDEEEQYTNELEHDRNIPRNLRLEWSTIKSYIAIENRDGLSNIARKLLKDVPTTSTILIHKELNDEHISMPNSESGKETIAISAFLLNTIQVPGLRKAMLREMWNSGADVMVIIEDATTKGFQNVTDARDFLLRRGSKQLDEGDKTDDSLLDNAPSEQGAHVLAPCPHDKPCPLAFHQKIFPSKRGFTELPSLQRMERCTFMQRLQRPSFVRLTKHAKRGEEDVGYSYVVIRRGERVRPQFGIGQLLGREGAVARWAEEAKKVREEERNEQMRNSWVMREDDIEPVSAIPVEDGLAMSEFIVEEKLDSPLEEAEDTTVIDGINEDEPSSAVSFVSESDNLATPDEDLEITLREESYSWPRINFSPMKRSGHVILDACTTEGTIMRMTFPRSQGKQIYYDARKSRWGDIFPHAPKSRPVPRFSGRPGKIAKTFLQDVDADERKAVERLLPPNDKRAKKTKRVPQQSAMDNAPDSVKASRAGWSGVFGQLKEEERRRRNERRKIRYEKEVDND